MMICRWQFIVAIPDSLLFSRQWPRRSRHLLTKVFEETIGDLRHRHLRCADEFIFGAAPSPTAYCVAARWGGPEEGKAT